MKSQNLNERCVSVKSSGKAVPDKVKQELLMMCIFNIINNVPNNSGQGKEKSA